MKMNGSTTYLLVFLVVSAVSLAALAAFNGVVDPYRAYRVVDLPELDPYRPTFGTRIAKAEALRHGVNGQDWDAVILGLSRSEFAVNPEHPSFEPGLAYNGSLLGCDMIELAAMFEHAVKTNELKTAVVFLEFYMFNEIERGHGDFEKSRLNPERIIPFYHLENLTSLTALTNSTDTLKRSWKKRRTEYRPNGYRPRDEVIRKWAHRDRFTEELSRFLKRGSTFRQYEYDTTRLDLVRHVIDLSRKHGVELHLIMSPTHVTHMEAIDAVGLWDTSEQWKRDLVTVVEQEAAESAQPAIPLWEFAGYHGFRAEPIAEGDDPKSMRWWWENSHYKEAIGDRILDCIFDRAVEGADSDPLFANFGERLNATNVESVLARIRADRAAYRESPGQESDWVHERAEAWYKDVHSHRKIREW